MSSHFTASGSRSDVLLLAGEVECAVLLGVDLFERDRAGGEVRGHLAGRRVDDRDVVVFLQRHGDLAGLVEGNEFGFGIFRRDFGEAGERRPS